MPATDEQNEVRGLRLTLRQLNRRQMTFEMVHPQKRTVMQGRQGPTGDRRHHQCPSETGRDCCRYSIDLIDGGSGLVQNLFDQHRQGFDMSPRRDLRNNTTPARMLFNLRCNS